MHMPSLCVERVDSKDRGAHGCGGVAFMARRARCVLRMERNGGVPCMMMAQGMAQG